MIGNGAGADITMGYVKPGTGCAGGCLNDYGVTQVTYPPDHPMFAGGNLGSCNSGA